MRHRILVLIIGLILTSQLNIFGQTIVPKFSEVEFDTRDLSQSGKSAYETLMTTQVFTINGYGIANQPYPQTLALATLLTEKNAEKALRSIIRNAYSEGQVYGLLGLQVIKSKQFKLELEIFKNLFTESENQKLEINSTFGGCVNAAVKLKRSEVVNNLKNGSLAKRFRFR